MEQNNMKKEIHKYNNKGLSHGYQELYFMDKLFVRGNSKNGDDIGYNEWHYTKRTIYSIR